MSQDIDDLALHEEFQELSKVKRVLEAEVLLQKEIMKTSLQLGFSFLIDSVSDDDIDDEHEICDEEIEILDFNHRCLDIEVKVLKDILDQNKKDLEKSKMYLEKEKGTPENEEMHLASVKSNQQLFEDIVIGKE